MIVAMNLSKEKLVWVLLRLSMAGIFLWAFFDKVFGLGFATTPDKSWLSGGSPTTGFLKFATYGPFKPFFESLAGNIWVDWTFMLALLLLGTALLFGIAMRLAAYVGTLLMLLTWLSLFQPKNNPLIDEHIIYALVFWVLYQSRAGEAWGLEKWWLKTPLVKNFPLLE